MAGTRHTDASQQQQDAGGSGRRTPWKWVAAHRLTSGIALAMVFLIVPLAGMWLLSSPQVEEGPVTLAQLLEALDRGELPRALALADRLASELDEPERGEIAAGIAFVRGAVASRQADEVSDANRVPLSLLAARYLDQAHELGFPAARRAEATLMWGKNYFRAGQFAACVEPLEAALKLHPGRAAEIRQWLIEACRRCQPPRLDKALEHSRQYLAGDLVFAEDRQSGLLVQAEILFEQHDFDGCSQVLSEIAAGTPQASERLILIARMRLAEARDAKASRGGLDEEVRKKYQAAMAVLDEALAAGVDKDRFAGRALYLLGVCHEELGETRAALERFAQTQMSYRDRDEGLAAMVHRAELLLGQGDDQEGLTTYRQALEWLKRADDYQNPWLPLEELRRRCLAVWQRWFKAGKYGLSEQLAASFIPLFDTARQQELLAQTHRAWAQSLVAAAANAPSAEASQQRQQIEQHFRLAGQHYLRLAELRFAEREYPDDLWNSIECLAAGQDHEQVIGVLQTYLRHEPVRRRTEALQRLGEALLVQGKSAEALAALEESISFDPRHPLLYRSKILASKARIDAGDVDAAEKLLLTNLHSDALAPASIEWRQTLFLYGRLLHLQARYQEAVDRLEEAVARYADDPQAVEARYLIADSYRQLAGQIQSKLDSVVVESARIAQARETHRLLEAAIAQYDQAVAALQSRGEHGGQGELPPAEATILRNCHFMKGAALFDMGKYEEAIRAYSSATNRYQQEPEVLDAYLKIADCYRRLNRPAEARGTIEQAKVVLNRIPSDVSFAGKSSFDRKEWARHLEWLSGL